MSIEIVKTDDLELRGGVPYRMLVKWRQSGVFTPWCVPRGRGNQTQFELMQAVGIAVANQIYHSYRSAARVYLKEVVRAFENTSEGWLLKQFEKNKTHLVVAFENCPVLAGKNYDWPDVKRIYDELKAVAETK